MCYVLGHLYPGMPREAISHAVVIYYNDLFILGLETIQL